MNNTYGFSRQRPLNARLGCRLCLVDLRDQELRVGEGKARTESGKEDGGSSAAYIEVIEEVVVAGYLAET
jgi:hypothetical protein